MFLIILLLAVNFGISWFNCWSVGGMWVESKALGGFVRVLAWCGATQAAIGFSSVMGAVLLFVAAQLHVLTPRAIDAAVSLWYLLIIVPAIGTGLIITIESWIAAYRERDLASMGTAAWNTFAQAHNIYEAFDGIPTALSSVTEFFKSDDSDEEGGTAVLIVVGVVAIALAGGIILTWHLIRKYSGRLPVPARG
jgi:hypothetical protein